MESRSFSVTLARENGYRFAVDFGIEGVAPLVLDEPPPLGEGGGPEAARVLGAAVGGCLAASLLFCLAKARIEVGRLETRVQGSIVRNEQGRWRIGHMAVTLSPQIEPGQEARLARCLERFEDFCIVTQSVRRGIDVAVTVEPITPGPAGP